MRKFTEPIIKGDLYKPLMESLKTNIKICG